MTTRETITIIGASLFHLVIARRGKAPTWQSSGRIPLRSVCHCEERKRRGNPAEPSGNHRIARASRIISPTGLPHPNGFAMTRVCGWPCPPGTGDDLHPKYVIIFPCKGTIST